MITKPMAKSWEDFLALKPEELTDEEQLATIYYSFWMGMSCLVRNLEEIATYPKEDVEKIMQTMAEEVMAHNTAVIKARGPL
jgi:hypothetical protein